MDPLGFFLWDEFLNPGKYQCDSCGTLFDEEDQCIEWCEDEHCYLFECPGCGVTGEIRS